MSDCVEEKVTANEAIEADKEEIRPDPYTLPDTFEWDTLDLDQREIVSTRRKQHSSQFHNIIAR